MNKKGYTLAEALVTLGIIGIIAALVVPAANKARPNENKMKFLQTYDAIETQIKNFTQNSRYFPTCQDGFLVPILDENGQQQRDEEGNLLFRTTRCFPDFPLYNTSDGVEHILNGIMDERATSNNKLCYLLADAMSARDVTVDGTDTVCTFTTPNGVSFAMGINNRRDNASPAMITNIIFNIRGDELNSVDEGTVRNNSPDVYRGNNININDAETFILHVCSNGEIIPGDLGSAYFLITRKNTRDMNITDDEINHIVRNVYGQSIINGSIISTKYTNMKNQAYFSQE